jgi:hypothetical protein
MVKLAVTKNVKLGRKVSELINETQNDFIVIPAFGDGNCAANAAGLLIIDLILRDKFDQAHYNTLYQAITDTMPTLQQRLALYQTGDMYSDVAEPLNEFIEFINTNPDWEQFSNFVKEKRKRDQIAALHVGLAPALRDIGIKGYAQDMKDREVPDEQIAQEIEALKQDGEHAGDELLMGIAHTLNINIHTYDENKGVIKGRVNVGDADGHILYVPGHWDFLIPADQTDGLAAVLPRGQVAGPSISFEDILKAAQTGYQAALATFNEETLKHTLFGKSHKVTSVAELQNIVDQLEGTAQAEAKGLLAAINMQDKLISEYQTPRK